MRERLRGNVREGNRREGTFARGTLVRGTFVRECSLGATFRATIDIVFMFRLTLLFYRQLID